MQFVATCKHELFQHLYELYFMFFNQFPDVFHYFPLMEDSFPLSLSFYILCRRGNNHFDVRFWRIGPVLFASKDGIDAVREGRNWRRNVSFPTESGFFPLYII